MFDPLDPTKPMTDDLAQGFVAIAAAVHLPDAELDPLDQAGTVERVESIFDIPAITERAFATTKDGLRIGHDWLSPDALHALIEQHRRPQHPVATTLPCPAWCDDQEGHPFDLRPHGNQRTHRHIIGERRATCVSVEHIERTPAGCAEGGPTDLGTDPGALNIALTHHAGTGYLTADGARRIAADLIAAADMLDAANAER